MYDFSLVFSLVLLDVFSKIKGNSGCGENDKRYDKTEHECEDMEKKDQTRPKKKKGKKRALMPKVPQLELRVFDHSFPYGLSLPSDVIKQVGRFHYLCLHIL